MKNILAILMGLLCLSSFAQDRVMLRNRVVLSGMVKKVDFENCLLQRTLGDTLIPMPQIKTIIYENGLTDNVYLRYKAPPNSVFAQEFEAMEGVANDDKKPKKYRKNYFHFGGGNIIFGELSVGVEHLIDNGKFGIKFPVKIGSGIFRDFYEDMYGLDFLMYPGRQGTIRFFYGLGYRMGSVYRNYSAQVSNGNGGVLGSGSTYQNRNELVNFRGPMITAGLFFRPLNWLGVNGSLGVGSVTVDGIVDPSGSISDRQKRRQAIPDLQISLVIGI